MVTALGWATWGVLAFYLLAFAGAGRLAARAAGRSIWLFGQAQGRERLAASVFRLAFAAALLGPLALLAWPQLQSLDPFHGAAVLPVMVVGHLIAVAGSLLAFAAQASMGASWRVGVREDAVGALVTDGLHGLSRNPTFLGQGLLLVGTALALPSIPTVLGALLFWFAARSQVASEECVLSGALGDAYRAYAARVPRWIGPLRQDAA